MSRLGQAIRILRNPHFWAILFLTAFFGALYYGQYLNISIWFPIHERFFQRDYPHDVHRMLFLIPMLYAALKFHIKGAVVISFVVSCIILPYGLSVSHHEDPTFRTLAFLLIASTATILLALSREQRNRTKILASIVESAEEAIISKSLDGTITSWNLGAEKLYGYSDKEAIGRPISMIIPGEFSDEIPNILRKIQRGEEVEQYETNRFRKDGSQIHIALRVSPIKDSNGRVTGASVMALDITRRKRVEEENAKLMAELEERIAVRHCRTI